MKVKVAQLCPALCDPHGLYSRSGHGILQARILEWVAFSLLQGIFPPQGSNPGLLPCTQILYPLSHQGSHSPSLSRLLMTCVPRALNFLSLKGGLTLDSVSLPGLCSNGSSTGPINDSIAVRRPVCNTQLCYWPAGHTGASQ